MVQDELLPMLQVAELTEEEAKASFQLQELAARQGYDHLSLKMAAFFCVGRKLRLKSALSTYISFCKFISKNELWTIDPRIAYDTSHKIFHGIDTVAVDNEQRILVTTNFLQVPKTRVKETVLFIIIVNMLSKLTVAHLRDGIVWIMTMKGFRWANYNSSLGTTITQFMLNCLPLKPKALYAVNSPWFISVILTIVKPFVSAKMKKRLFVIDEAELRKVFGVGLLPPEVGGTNRFEQIDETRYGWYAEELQRMCWKMPVKRSKGPWRSGVCSPREPSHSYYFRRSIPFAQQLSDVDEISSFHYLVTPNPGEHPRHVVGHGDFGILEREFKTNSEYCNEWEAHGGGTVNWPDESSSMLMASQMGSCPPNIAFETLSGNKTPRRAGELTDEFLDTSDTSLTCNPSYATIIGKEEQGGMLTDWSTFSKISPIKFKHTSVTPGRLAINRHKKSQQSASSQTLGSVTPYTLSYSEKQTEWPDDPLERNLGKLSRYTSGIILGSEEQKTSQKLRQQGDLEETIQEQAELISPRNQLSKVLSEKILEQARQTMMQYKRQSSQCPPVHHREERPRLVSALPQHKLAQHGSESEPQESQNICRGGILLLCSLCSPSTYVSSPNSSVKAERVIFWKKRAESKHSLSERYYHNSEHENRLSVSLLETQDEIFF